MAPSIKRARKTLPILQGSQFFDASWYLDTYPDVRAAGIDPALHYLLHGADEDRDPSRWFSTAGYKRDFPELVNSKENPLLHYLRNRGSNPTANPPIVRQRAASAYREQGIPRLFHSVWLSGEEAPSPLRLAVESFRKLHPDFEIRKWTLEDFHSDSTRFLREAIQQKKWAFATDYIRLKSLYEYGGVYADGDVSFYHRVDEYLRYDSVLCWETHFAVGPHFLMSRPKNKLIERLLKVYEERTLLTREELDLTPMPVIITWILATEFGLTLDGSRQILEKNNIIESQNVFTTNFDDQRCVAEHLYYGGWTQEYGGSYKDALPAIAARWVKENTSKKARALRAVSTAEMRWSYYFLRNAEAAFPGIAELPELDHFRSFTTRFLGGSLISRRAILKAVEPADPRHFISKWHRSPRVKIASPIVEHVNLNNPDKNINVIMNQGRYKINIVVPIYNVKDYLIRCLKSIQAQTHTHFEVLLIDDGSTDGSATIARSMCEVDSRFRYFYKKNGGLGDARNFAIQHLDSDIVTFVDSDDFLSPDHLEKLEIKFRYGHDLAICDFNQTTPDGRVIESRGLARYWGEDDPIIHALVSQYECYAWNKMYLTEAFTQNDKARYSLGWFEDLALTPALISCSRNLAFVDSKTYNYVQRPGSILASARMNIKRNIEIFDSLQMLKEHRDRIPERYWNLYMDWMAPKHYFYWRISAILGEKSHGIRVATASEFSHKLNATIPNWANSAYIDSFVREPIDMQQRLRRETLIKAFKNNDLSFYARAQDLREFGI